MVILPSIEYASHAKHSATGFALFAAVFNELAISVGASEPENYSLKWPFTKVEIKEDPYKRLRIGPTFEDLVALYREVSGLEGLRATSVRQEVSAMLDLAIDQGAVVPTIAKYNGSFYRIYRKGESEPRDRAIERSLRAWSLYGKPLSLTRYSKISAILSFAEGVEQILDPETMTRGNVATLPSSVLDRGSRGDRPSP